MSWDPGLVIRIDRDWMDVKVPTGEDCEVCPIKSACSFEGPEKAYRTFRVARMQNLYAGDRVEVEMPASVLGVTSLVIVILPAVMLALGYAWSVRHAQVAGMPYLPWLVGVGIWFTAIYLANRWMTRSPRFEARVRPNRATNGDNSKEEAQ